MNVYRGGSYLWPLTRAFTWEDLVICTSDLLAELLEMAAEVYPDPGVDGNGWSTEDLDPCLGHIWQALDDSEEEESWDGLDGSPWCKWWATVGTVQGTCHKL
ncbi:hypothetical protein SKAU_G00085150 [Synaphobranchus kaupii]|uniref:Uncharacterized protein n=1 Tax=Synaphobranchus kaupii TaxID=118154 RepID=A0A9Q1FVS4_SYNKA|nr:hypothetical protein SKAU_G00085150 [Synaphobranchus kaupii]